MKKGILLLLTIGLLLSTATVSAQKKKEAAKEPEKKEGGLSSSTFGSLSFRSIGPAWASGRISDFAVNPKNHSEIYAGISAGNIWKTTNNGTTWAPIFDKYGAYAIGCLKMDPENPSVIWAGTGENTHQRQLGYGDGVYKTEDGGASWKNMGLKESRQIGMIEIDPRNTDVVYVAAEGSIWGPGGERGLYKTTDGGKTFKSLRGMHVDHHGLWIDPANSDYLLNAQDGGIAISYDKGKNWKIPIEELPLAQFYNVAYDFSTPFRVRIFCPCSTYSLDPTVIRACSLISSCISARMLLMSLLTCLPFMYR